MSCQRTFCSLFYCHRSEALFLWSQFCKLRYQWSVSPSLIVSWGSEGCCTVIVCSRGRAAWWQEQPLIFAIAVALNAHLAFVRCPAALHTFDVIWTVAVILPSWVTVHLQDVNKTCKNVLKLCWHESKKLNNKKSVRFCKETKQYVKPYVEFFFFCCVGCL